MNEKYVSTEQGKVHYWTSEKWDIKNDTLFFFPGLTADHSMFEKQVEYFKNKYNIIVNETLVSYHELSRKENLNQKFTDNTLLMSVNPQTQEKEK